MTKDEAMKMALEALECLKRDFDADQFEWGIADEAITAIKEALAQPEQEPVAWEQFHEHMAGPFYKAPPQPEKEPVAWGVFEVNLHDMFFTEAEAVEMAQLKGTHAEVRPLYTTPPQRKPLTLGQKQRLWSSVGDKPTLKDRVNAYGLAIEAAHGIFEQGDKND